MVKNGGEKRKEGGGFCTKSSATPRVRPQPRVAPSAARRLQAQFFLKNLTVSVKFAFRTRFRCLFPRGGCEARPSRPPPFSRRTYLGFAELHDTGSRLLARGAARRHRASRTLSSHRPPRGRAIVPRRRDGPGVRRPSRSAATSSRSAPHPPPPPAQHRLRRRPPRQPLYPSAQAAPRTARTDGQWLSGAGGPCGRARPLWVLKGSPEDFLLFFNAPPHPPTPVAGRCYRVTGGRVKRRQHRGRAGRAPVWASYRPVPIAVEPVTPLAPRRAWPRPPLQPRSYSAPQRTQPAIPEAATGPGRNRNIP